MLIIEKSSRSSHFAYLNIFMRITYLFKKKTYWRLNIVSKVSLRLWEVLHYNFDIRMWLGKILNHILHFFSHTILSFILPSISTNSSSLLLCYTPICPLIHSHGQCKWGSLEHFSGQNKFFFSLTGKRNHMTCYLWLSIFLFFLFAQTFSVKNSEKNNLVF